MTRTVLDAPAPGGRLYSHSFRAMGCAMGAWVVSRDARAARRGLRAVETFMRATEALLSRFRPHSELNRLNAAGGQPRRVSPTLAAVLSAALASARQTEGLYDPTILDSLEHAGYDRSFEDMRDSAEAPAPLAPRPSRWQDIRLDRAARRVVLPPGVRLDFGGIAKGWAADAAARQLAQVGPCLVDAGGDIVARGGPVDWPAWPVGVADPRRPDSDLALLMLLDRAVATSGTDYRRWRRGDALQHHVIDPRRQAPALTDLISVTVVAPTATQADVTAKVALILGSAEGLRYLAQQPDVEGVLVGEDGAIAQTVGFEGYVYHRESPGGGDA